MRSPERIPQATLQIMCAPTAAMNSMDVKFFTWISSWISADLWSTPSLPRTSTPGFPLAQSGPCQARYSLPSRRPQPCEAKPPEKKFCTWSPLDRFRKIFWEVSGCAKKKKFLFLPKGANEALTEPKEPRKPFPPTTPTEIEPELQQVCTLVSCSSATKVAPANEHP